MSDTKKHIISHLQKQILQWQGFIPPPASEAKGIGLGPLEAAFPNGVFPAGAIHEMVCPSPEHTAATTGIVAGLIGLLMKQGGACLWISLKRRLFPVSLAAFGVPAHQVIFIDLQHEKDVLWVMEQALKCEGLAAVIAEVQEISIIQSRRLQLAVESSKVTGFLLRNDLRKLGANTCVARWKVSPLPSNLADDLPGVGHPQWQVELLRVRNGNPGKWKLIWADNKFIPVEEKQTEIMSTLKKVG